MTWFDDFKKASPDEQRDMLAKKKADDSAAFLRKMRGEPEPEHEPAQHHKDEAEAWLNRVHGPRLDDPSAHPDEPT